MTTTPTPQPTWSDALAYPLAAVGAILGAVVGAFLTYIAFRSGIYAIIAVGFCTGFGAALFARRKNIPVALIASLVTLVAGIYTEWNVFWSNGSTLPEFLSHLQNLPPFHILVHLVGIALAFYLGWRK